MTAQMPDQFVLSDHVYSIVGIKGGELFRPSVKQQLEMDIDDN